jgi:thiazole synthase
MESWTLGGRALRSRILLGTSRYPSPAAMQDAVRRSGAEIVTVSLRRESAAENGGQRFWEYLRSLGVHVLPNTAGCHDAREAIETARMARDLFDTPWIKLEVIGDDYSLAPDPFGLVEAARVLSAEGFVVFPYTTDDLVVAERLLEAGCRILMPWGSPIGTGRGLTNPAALAAMRARFPDVPLIVDAGLGRPSHAAQAMELGFDGVLLNTAVAGAHDPGAMGEAFADAVRGGRKAFEAGLMRPREGAVPSTPLIGRAFRASGASP